MDILGLNISWKKIASFSLQNIIDNSVESVSENGNIERVIRELQVNYVLRLKALNQYEKNFVMLALRSYYNSKRKIDLDLKTNPFQLNYIDYTGEEMIKNANLTNISGGTLTAEKEYLYKIAVKNGDNIGVPSKTYAITTTTISKKILLTVEEVNSSITEIRYYRSDDGGITWGYYDDNYLFLDDGSQVYTSVTNVQGLFNFNLQDVKPVFENGYWNIDIPINERWYT